MNNSSNHLYKYLSYVLYILVIVFALFSMFHIEFPYSRVLFYTFVVITIMVDFVRYIRMGKKK